MSYKEKKKFIFDEIQCLVSIVTVTEPHESTRVHVNRTLDSIRFVFVQMRYGLRERFFDNFSFSFCLF